MTMTVEFILVGVIGFGAGFLLNRAIGSRRISTKKLQTAPIAVQKPGSLPADVEERVRALIENGHKIGALKELRDSTDIGLEEAKDIVESIAATSNPSDNNNEATLAPVRDLIRSGKKAEALKLYSESSGMNLKETEEAIDKMEKEFG